MSEQRPLLQISDSEEDNNLKLKRNALNSLRKYKPTVNTYSIAFAQLSKIIKNGNIEKLKQALEDRNAQLSDTNGGTVLHVAAATNNTAVLTELLQNKRVQPLLNVQDNLSSTPLMVAWQTSSYKTLELLCSIGADPMKTWRRNAETVLHSATYAGDVLGAQILLKYYTWPNFINCMDKGGDTPLIVSIHRKSQVFDVLIENGADITIKNPENGRTVLHVAVAYNRFTMMKKLVQHPKATVEFADTIDVAGENALLIAVKLAKLDLIKILTSEFNNLSNINHVEKQSVFHHAVIQNRPDILKQLLKSTSSSALEYHDNEFRTPIMLAAEMDNASCLQELIKYGADYYAKNPNSGETILHIVAKNHSNLTLPFLTSLAHISWFLDQTDHSGNTPYMSAIMSGNDAFLREAFKLKKIDLCDYNSEGETPTYYTVKQGYPNVLQTLLLSPKYYVFAKKKQNTLEADDPEEILKAEIRGDIYATDVYILLGKVIQYPLVKWFPPHLILKTKTDRNVFHGCALSGSLECLKFLYEFFKLFAPKQYMDDFDADGIAGNTPCLFAAQCGSASVSCLKYFVRHGAKLTATNVLGANVVQAIWSHNPDAVHVVTELFNNCVTAKKTHYSSDRLDIQVDFSIFMPKNEPQMKVANIFFRETRGSDRQKILQHPVLSLFLKLKLKKSRKVFYYRFITSCVTVLLITVLTPVLYLGKTSPESRFGQPYTVLMRCVYFIALIACIINTLLKIPAMCMKDIWFSDVLSTIPSLTMITMMICGRSFFFTPELAATLILTSWMIVLTLSINIYSDFSYQLSVYFRLLNNISKQLFVLTVIIFAFALSFFCLYNDSDKFKSFPVSLLYTFIVLLPGLLTDLPTFKKTYFKETPITFHFIAECVTIGLFIIVAITGFVNMLVGLAVRGGKHLESDGKIFKNHHAAHYLASLECWLTKASKLLKNKKGFSFFEVWKNSILIKPCFHLYAKENIGVCDNETLGHLRSIISKRHNAEIQSENEKINQSLEDVFDDPFGHLPGAKPEPQRSQTERSYMSLRPVSIVKEDKAN